MPTRLPELFRGALTARRGAQGGKRRRREEDVATRAVLGHLSLVLWESISPACPQPSAPGTIPAWLASPPIQLPEAGPWEVAPRPPPVPPRTLPACGPLDPPSALQPGPASLEPQRAARGHFTQLVHSSPHEVGVGGSGAGWGASEGGKPTCLVRAQPPAQVRARARWP